MLAGTLLPNDNSMYLILKLFSVKYSTLGSMRIIIPWTFCSYARIPSPTSLELTNFVPRSGPEQAEVKSKTPVKIMP
jgi:hypothetical protein